MSLRLTLAPLTVQAVAKLSAVIAARIMAGIVAFVLACTCAFADSSFRVVAVYPHDVTAFTQGLVYQDGHLLEGTGLRGGSELRQVVLETGEVVRRHSLDARLFGEGITVLDGRIYQLTWQAGRGFIYSADDFRSLGSFTYRGEGWGLTDDGESLILSDGSDRLRFIDPATLRLRRSVRVFDEAGPVVRLNELEYVDGRVLANVFQTSRIVEINPASGRVERVFDLGELSAAEALVNRNADVLNGIAYDAVGQRLFVTGKRWSRLYEIQLQD